MWTFLGSQTAEAVKLILDGNFFLMMSSSNRVVDTPLVRETGLTSPPEEVEARAVVSPLTAGERERRDKLFVLEDWDNFGREMFKLFSPIVFLIQVSGEGLTILTHQLYGVACIPCDNVRDNWYMEDVMARRAYAIVDGPDDDNVESLYAPEMFLELAPDVVHQANPNGFNGDDFQEPTRTINRSVAIQHDHSLEVGAHVVRNNYVIVKGKRGFYCHSLLSLLKGRLGRIPHDALHEKIVRRHAFKECDNHGLRPGDKRLAVEFVVRMYWKESKLEREVDAIAGSYDGGVRVSWVRRMFNRFKRSQARKKSQLAYHE